MDNKNKRYEIDKIIVDIENELNESPSKENDIKDGSVKKTQLRNTTNKGSTKKTSISNKIDNSSSWGENNNFFVENKKESLNNKSLRKKDYMERRKSHLKKGAILPIYEDWKEQKKLMGYAKLNKRISKDSEEYPYERVSIGSGKIKSPDMVIYKFQRWNITFVDPYEFNPNMSKEHRWKYLSQKGFTTNYNLSYFETVDSNYIS